MTSATAKRYCWTCRTEITPARWARHIKSIGHVRRAAGDSPPFVQPKARDAAEDEPEEELTDGNSSDDHDDGEPDTRTPCGGCSKRITPGSEYWRDDGRAYHNGCVPLATTRPLDPTRTAQAAPQQASTLLAGVGAQGQAKRPLLQPRPTTTSASRNAP